MSGMGHEAIAKEFGYSAVSSMIGRTLGAYTNVSKIDLLDSYINAWAGAMVLRYNLARYPFCEAVGRYHTGEKKSEGPIEKERQISYAGKVYFVLLNLSTVPSIKRQHTFYQAGPPSALIRASGVNQLCLAEGPGFYHRWFSNPPHYRIK